jgi:dephospho-CoA kinase
MVKIIAITGLKRSGKDTIADYISYKYKYEHMKISSTLKSACEILFGFSLKQMETDEKDVVDKDMGITPRLAMQFFGTEIMQYKIQEIMPGVGRCFWINLLLKNIGSNNDSRIVISDMRFLHEYTRMKEMHDIFVIKVCRNRQGATQQTQDMHPSELEWQTIPENELIENNGSIQDLFDKIDKIVGATTN